MSNTTVYRWVIDDVIAKAKPEFVQEGVDESVLDELRKRWEAKMQAQGLIGNEPAGPAPGAPGHAGPSGYGLPQPPVPALPAAAAGGVAAQPLALTSALATIPGMAAAMQMVQGLIRPGQPFPTAAFQQALAHQQAQIRAAAAAAAAAKQEQQPPLALGVQHPMQQQQLAMQQQMQLQMQQQQMQAGLDGQKRGTPDGGYVMQQQQQLRFPGMAPNVPQRDGAADEPGGSLPPAGTRRCPGGARQGSGKSLGPGQGGPMACAEGPAPSAAAAAAAAAQSSGDAGEVSPSQPAAAAGPWSTGAAGPAGRAGRGVIPQRDGPAGNDDAGDGAEGSKEGEEATGDEILSEDSEADEDEGEFSDFLCCQFEKVTRTKNRWKVNLRDGVFHMNGRDYLFKKATGEWLF